MSGVLLLSLALGGAGPILVQPGNSQPAGVISTGACPSGFTGDGVCFDSNGATGSTRSGTTDPEGLLIRPQSCAPGDASCTAANLHLFAGQDTTTITIDDYAQGVDGDTVALLWTNNSGTTTTTTFTGRSGAPGANEFKIETSNAVTATNLAAAITTSLSSSGITATAASGVVSIFMGSGVAKTRMTESRAAFTTVAVGTPGILFLQGWLGISYNIETATAYICSQGSANGAGLCNSGLSVLGHWWTEGLQVGSNVGSTVSSRVDTTAGFSHQSAAVGIYIPTTGTFGGSTVGYIRPVWVAYTWTNAMLAACAAGGTCDITIATLPAKTRVLRALTKITTAATFAPGTLTMSVGKSAGGTEYVLAGDIKAAANTIYGDADAEIGASLYSTSGDDHRIDDIPSWTGTTTLNARLTAGAGDVNAVTASTGTVYMQVEILP